MNELVAIDWNPSERKLRHFGFVAFAALGLLALLAQREAFVFASGLGAWRTSVSLGLCGVGVLSLLFSLLAPRHNRPLYLALMLLGYPVGMVVSRCMLALLFFAILGPVALCFRILGRDALQRHVFGAERSYWLQARPERDKLSYFRQF